MEDPNLIAELFPIDGEDNAKYTWDIIRMRENTSRYIPPQGESKSDFRSRESTPSSEDKEGIIPNNTSYPGLQLTFNPGLVLGTDPDCDIVLPQLRQISQRHYYLTFDSQR